MHKFFVLLQQSYRQKLSSKTFILSTSLYVLILCGVAFFDDIKELFTNEEETQKVVLYNGTEASFLDSLQLGDKYEVELLQDEQAVEQAVSDEEAQIGVVLNDDGQLAATLYSLEPMPLKEQTFFDEQFTLLATNFAYEKIQLTVEQQQIIANVAPNIHMVALNEAPSKSAEEKQAGMVGSYIVGILIYIFVISYLSIITTDVASEKGSRVLEMVLVGIKPETHFKAKVFATMLVAITQFAVAFVVGVIIVLLKPNDELVKFVMDVLRELEASYIIFVVLFLLLTLLIYLIVGALFGSLVAKVEEASQVMTPAMIIIIAAFYVMVTAFNNPDALLVKICSYIPFTAGMVMPMRLGGSDISVIEPIISIIVLAITVFGLYQFSMVYYKRSVLSYSTGGLLQKLKQLFKTTL